MTKGVNPMWLIKVSLRDDPLGVRSSYLFTNELYCLRLAKKFLFEARAVTPSKDGQDSTRREQVAADSIQLTFYDGGKRSHK